MENNKILTSSFRDPSGFLFLDKDILYRQINSSYKEEYDQPETQSDCSATR